MNKKTAESIYAKYEAERYKMLDKLRIAEVKRDKLLEKYDAEISVFEKEIADIEQEMYSLKEKYIDDKPQTETIVNNNNLI